MAGGAEADALHWKTEDGARLFARITGANSRGGAIPALLLHSLFFDGSMFNAILPALAAERASVIPDHRGQGRSQAGGLVPTCQQLANDMISLCDRLGLQKVHVVGSSMGAYVGMEMLRIAPERLASVVISCCTCDAEANPGRFDALATFLAGKDRPGLAERIAQLMFGRPFLTSELRREERNRWLLRFAELPRSIGAVARAMFAHGAYRDVLLASNAPILAIAGGQDNAKSPADLAWIGELGRGRFVELAASGHTAPIETPVEYAAELRAFLRRHDVAAASIPPR